MLREDIFRRAEGLVGLQPHAACNVEVARKRPFRGKVSVAFACVARTVLDSEFVVGEGGKHFVAFARVRHERKGTRRGARERTADGDALLFSKGRGDSRASEFRRKHRRRVLTTGARTAFGIHVEEHRCRDRSVRKLRSRLKRPERDRRGGFLAAFGHGGCCYTHGKIRKHAERRHRIRPEPLRLLKARARRFERGDLEQLGGIALPPEHAGNRILHSCQHIIERLAVAAFGKCLEHGGNDDLAAGRCMPLGAFGFEPDLVALQRLEVLEDACRIHEARRAQGLVEGTCDARGTWTRRRRTASAPSRRARELATTPPPLPVSCDREGR